MPSDVEESARDSSESLAQNAESEANKSIHMAVKRVGLATLILSMGIFLSRILGYVREAVIAYQAGAGAATDAYNAAFMLPDLMNYFLAGGTLSITFIPLYAAYLAKNQTDKAQRLFSLIATTMGTLLGLAIVFCAIFTPELSRLLFPGFNAEQLKTTVEMTRVILPGQFFHYIGALMMAVLMARGQFLPSALAPLIYNGSIIVFGLILGPKLGMMGFAIGALVGALFGPFCLPLFFVRKKLKYRPIISINDADFKKYIFLTLPLMLGVSLTSVDEWVGRYLGSMMEAGSISWLNYARRLVLVPIAIVGQAAGQAALPYLSQLSARGELKKTAEILHKTLSSVVILSLLLLGFFIVLAEPMVALVYERGAFTAQDTANTAGILRILAISILFWTLQMVSVRAFYAAQDTLRPMILTTSMTLLSLPIYYLLSQSFGLLGLASASCVGMAMQAASILIFYRLKNSHFKLAKLIKPLVIGSLLGLTTGLGSLLGLWLSRYIHFDSRTLLVLSQLMLSGGLGALMATALARLIAPSFFVGFKKKLIGKFKK